MEPFTVLLGVSGVGFKSSGSATYLFSMGLTLGPVHVCGLGRCVWRAVVLILDET